MGAAASITGRQDSDAQLIPTLKVTRKENIIRIKSTRSLKKTRRPSFFDERSKSDSGDMEMDSLILESTEGEVLNPTTRGILVRAVEEFLTMNGTDLRSNVIDVVVNSMHPLLLHRGQSVITQGEIGSFVYVLESGNVAVIVNGQEVRTMSSGTLFGELALLFDARRSATITCLEKCKLWSLNRSAFKIIQRNATNLAIMQRTRRFQVVPELAVLPSEALARLVTSLAPTSYKFGDQIYTLGKCSTKVMLIEEGKVEILVPPNLQHLTQEEIERTVGVMRPASYEYRRKSASGQESNSQSTEEVTKIKAFSISEGCIIGMSILLGKIGSPCGWTWVDAKVDGKPYVGAMPPVTATAEGVVKTSFFTVYRFERILGSAEAFYESYFGIFAGTEKAKLWPFNIVPHTEPQEDPEPFKFQPQGEFCLSYFDTIVPIHSVNMGYFALGYKSGVGANVNKYLLKRLFKSTIASQNTVKHVLDEAKILEAMNCSTVYNSVMQFLWCNV